MCLVMASVPLCYKYLFLYDFLFIHPKLSVGFCRKRLFGLSETSVHCCFGKITVPKVYAYLLPSKTSRVESLLNTLAGLPGTFPKSSLEQLFYRESVSACFCKKELHSTRYLRSFPEF